MQKKIIALAVAAAFTVPVMSYAAADVYGIAHVSIDIADNGAEATGTKSSSANQLNSNRSRVGLKGSEDLGNGLSAMWQMEGTVGMDAGGFSMNRNTFVGLSSADMGTLVLGRHDTPYKISTRKLDVFKDTAADNRDSGMLSGHDARLNNVIAYISPDFSGLTVAVASTFDAENATTSTAPNADKKAQVISLAGMYSRDNIYATLAYQGIKAGSGTTTTGQSNIPGTMALDDESNALKFGGGYTMDQFTVNAFIESLTDKTVAAPATETTGTNVYLGATFAVSETDAVKLAYTQRGEATTTTSGAPDTKVKKGSQISIGYDHDMSKNTRVYALYSAVTDDAGVGVTAAADPTVISFGLKHSF